MSERKFVKNDPLEKIQVVSSAPSSVPSSVFIRLENETCRERSVYSNIPGLTASNDIKFIKSLNDNIVKLNEIISQIYCRRTISETIKKHLKQPIEDPAAVSNIAVGYLTPLAHIVKDAKTTCENCIQEITNVINHVTTRGGEYSDVLFDHMCLLIYKLMALDLVNEQKRSILADMRYLITLIDTTRNMGMKEMTDECIVWMDNKNNIENHLRRGISNTDIKKFSQILWTYIKSVLPVKSFINPDLHYAHIVTLIFFFRLSPNPISVSQDEMGVLQKGIGAVPYIPLYHEVALDAQKMLQSVDACKGIFNGVHIQSIDTILPTLRSEFSDISSRIARYLSAAINVDEVSQNIVADLNAAICLISYAKGLLRELYVGKLMNPPGVSGDGGKQTGFERAIRQGFRPAELSASIQLLALCRELGDLLRDNATRLYWIASAAMHTALQVFVKHRLAKAHMKMKKHKDKLGPIYDRLRMIAGDYLRDEDPSMTARQATKPREHRITQKDSAPSPQLVELLRISVQHITNPESEFAASSGMFGGGSLRDKEKVMLADFVQSSLPYVDLIAFDQSLYKAVDQSDFYFKEVMLDTNGVFQFPVKASLPFTLCQYALDNYQHIELTELIFYPLSIYDDAAYAAINTHKSQLMFTEVQAESQVCLDTLAALISEFCFNAFRTFSALRQFPQKLVAQLKAKPEIAEHWPVSTAYRLRTLLAQNQIYLLAKHINLKSLISPRVDEQMNTAVQQLYEMAKEHGLAASLAISHGIDALRDTHRMLVENGIPLMPFPQIERSAKEDNTPLAFDNAYFRHTVSHLFKDIVTRYTLLTNPFRFVPSKPIQLPSEPLGKNYLGRIIKEACSVTVTFVTFGHFHFFVRHISDGTFSLLFDQVKTQVRRNFEHFLKSFQGATTKFERIKDAPYGTPATTVFERFESSYRFLNDDPAVARLLKSMMAIGNLITAVEMLDEAATIKHMSVEQALDFIRSAGDDGVARDDVKELFDEGFRGTVEPMLQISLGAASRASGVLTRAAVRQLVALLNEHKGVFKEDTIHPGMTRLPALQGMRAFPAMWAVIEFVYAQQEATRTAESQGLKKYGSGVPLAAALVTLITQQLPLVRAVSVNKKIERAALVDVSGNIDEKVTRHIAIAESIGSVFDWALNLFEPIITSAMH